jgi:hypothetical protein
MRRRQGGGAPQRVFDEHGGVLDLWVEIWLRPIWSNGFSHGRGGVFWQLLDRRQLQPCAWTASFLSDQFDMEVIGSVGAYRSRE